MLNFLSRLLASCLPLVCKLFWLLRSYNLTSSDIVDEFEAVQQLVEGERDITWGDDCDNKEPENSNGGFTETSFDQLIDLKPVDDKLIKCMFALWACIYVMCCDYCALYCEKVIVNYIVRKLL